MKIQKNIEARNSSIALSAGTLSQGNYEVHYYPKDSTYGFGAVMVTDKTTGCYIINTKYCRDGYDNQALNVASAKLALQDCHNDTYYPCDRCREQGKGFEVSASAQIDVFSENLPHRPETTFSMIDALSHSYQLLPGEDREIYECIKAGADKDSILEMLYEDYFWDDSDEDKADQQRLLSRLLTDLDTLRVEAGDKWAKKNNIQPKYKVGDVITCSLGKESFVIRRVHNNALLYAPHLIEACSYDIERVGYPSWGYRLIFEDLEAYVSPDAPYGFAMLLETPHFYFPDYFPRTRD